MLKPLLEKAGRFVCPQRLLEILPKGSRVLLESTLTNSQNRWAILAYEASSRFVSREGRSWLDGEECFGNPFTLVSELMSKVQIPCEDKQLPFLGGWMGCVSYEAARFLEKIPTHEDRLGFDLAFYFVDSFFIFDLVDKEIYYVSSQGKIPELRAYLESVSSDSIPPIQNIDSSLERIQESSKLDKNFTQKAYLETIQTIQNYIRDGHSYQVNLSQVFSIENSVEPIEIYKLLSQLSPVPFAGFFEWEQCTVLSGSPERLFEVKASRITTRPIAGTRRCGSIEETEQFIRELSQDPKEHSEHCMLVDLARNDLGRICKHGSVSVSKFMEIVPYKTVIHTESEIQGTLLDSMNFLEIMRALFPGGTITGVPKIRTMEIIHELEPCSRGIYTGSLGYWSVCGHADFNIMIRPILCKQGKAYTHAGGGITCKAQAHREYKETLHKARSQILAILEANGL